VSHGAVMLSIWAHLAGGYQYARVPHNCGILSIEYQEGSLGGLQIFEDE
jgi:hypothetical protein